MNHRLVSMSRQAAFSSRVWAMAGGLGVTSSPFRHREDFWGPVGKLGTRHFLQCCTLGPLTHTRLPSDFQKRHLTDTTRQENNSIVLSASASDTSQLQVPKSQIPNIRRVYPIRAFYIARRIDFMKYYSEVFSKTDCVHYLQRDGLLLSFQSNVMPDGDVDSTMEPPLPNEKRHLFVFGYGSVVFYNFEEWKIKEIIKQSRKYCTEPFELPAAEDYAVSLRPTREEGVYPEFISVVNLDIHHLRVISSVIGHTVALDHYEGKVNEMLEQFRTMNGDVEKRGSFALQQQMLFKSVATNNAILTDMIRNLRLLDRSDTAWKSERFAKLWDGLREEFEVESRFKRLDFKLDLIQLNTKFFLEINQHQKSERLEWIIVWLLAGEVAMALCKVGAFGDFPHHLVSQWWA